MLVMLFIRLPIALLLVEETADDVELPSNVPDPPAFWITLIMEVLICCWTADCACAIAEVAVERTCCASPLHTDCEILLMNVVAISPLPIIWVGTDSRPCVHWVSRLLRRDSACMLVLIVNNVCENKVMRGTLRDLVLEWVKLKETAETRK